MLIWFILQRVRRTKPLLEEGWVRVSFFFWVSWKFSQDSRLLLNQGGHIPRTFQWALGFFSGLRVWTKVPNLSYTLLCLIYYRSYTFNMIHRTCIWHFRSKFQANFWFRPFWIYVSSDFSACPQNRVWCLKLKHHSKNQKKHPKKCKLPPKGGGLVQMWDPFHDPGHGRVTVFSRGVAFFFHLSGGRERALDRRGTPKSR